MDGTVCSDKRKVTFYRMNDHLFAADASVSQICDQQSESSRDNVLQKLINFENKNQRFKAVGYFLPVLSKKTFTVSIIYTIIYAQSSTQLNDNAIWNLYFGKCEISMGTKILAVLFSCSLVLTVNTLIRKYAKTHFLNDIIISIN